jgi:large subunit ribosomal protein L29
MASPETAELRERAADQLREEMEEAHQALFNLRFQAATRQLADVSQVGKARRRISRIKTLLREREIIAEADRLAASEEAVSEHEGDDDASAEANDEE